MSGFQPKTASRLSTHMAKFYEKNGEYDNALYCYNQALAEDYNNLAAHQGKAFILLELERFHEAQEHLRIVLDSYPEDDKLYCMLAKSLMMDEQYNDNESLPCLLINEAEDLLNEAVKISKKDEYYNYLELARLFIIKHEYEQAMPLLQKSVELNPDFEESYLLMSGCCYETGDESAAITWSMKARMQNIKNLMNKRIGKKFL